MRISDFAGGSAGILAPVYAGERRFTDHDNQMQHFKGVSGVLASFIFVNDG